jgi:transcriptional regulator with XRE-family HTH domain
MATNEVPRGPVSRYVVENVKRLRADYRWSLAELSAEMTRVGRPMLASGLNRIEQGRRRVDADDLVGLALALQVTPITLLLPTVPRGTLLSAVTIELTNSVTADARMAWDWIRGERTLSEDEDEDGFVELDFRRRSLPPGLVKYDQLSRAGQEGWEEHRAELRRLRELREGGDPDGEHQAPS